MIKSKKQKGFQKFVVFAITFIAVFIIVVYASKYLGEKKLTENDYNNFKFRYSDAEKVWYVEVQMGPQPFTIPFYNHPRDLEDIVVEEDIEKKLLTPRPSYLIIAVPSESSSMVAIAGVQISRITGNQVLGIPTSSAVNDNDELGLPYVNCNDADEDTIVINFENSDKNIISSSGNCIRIEFTSANESVRVAEAFVYNLLTIM